MTHHIEMVKTLRASGHRLTPQREGVLAVICDSQAHLSAEEILQRVRMRYPYLNKSAVYRSLELLTQLGLVTQTDLGQGRVQVPITRAPPSPSPHLPKLWHGLAGRSRQFPDLWANA